MPMITVVDDNNITNAHYEAYATMKRLLTIRLFTMTLHDGWASYMKVKINIKKYYIESQLNTFTEIARPT